MGSIGVGADDLPRMHRGYVAGRYRDGALSDSWTDVTRCAERTFIAYRARCECGWLGDPHPANPAGYHSCHDELISKHLCPVVSGTLATAAHLPAAPNPSS